MREEQPDRTKLEIAENAAIRELCANIPFHRPVNGCWLWPRYRNSKGYGVIAFDGFKFPVHRLSFKLHKGEIPKGLFVMHDCDVPACFNPNHLFLGTPQDNVADMHRKGRRRREEKDNRE